MFFHLTCHTDPAAFLNQAMDPPNPRAVKSALEVLQVRLGPRIGWLSVTRLHLRGRTCPLTVRVTDTRACALPVGAAGPGRSQGAGHT
jgi:hypothetical protein